MFERITFDPGVMGGRACIRGMRITVALVVNLVANGMSTEEIIREYPELEREDVRQSLQYASALANEEIRFFQSPAALDSWPTWTCRNPHWTRCARPTATPSIFATKDSYAFPCQSRTARPPNVVIFRLRNQTPVAVNPRLFRVIHDCAVELALGALVIVEDERFRVRRRLPFKFYI